MTTTCSTRWTFLVAALFAVASLGGGMILPQPAEAQPPTGFGELEGRPAPVSLRRCLGGANAGDLCNENADCPGSSCQDRNIYNVSVSVRFNATAAQLTTIRNAMTAGSELLFDATDGQAQFGQVMLFNNSSGSRGHYWVTNTLGSCGANTGTWGTYTGGNITTPMARLSAGTAAGCVAHEFLHFAFDTKDEYETNPTCISGTSGYTCPDISQGPNSAAEEACLMECCGRVGTELCWGQAVGDNLAAGNHDATNVTEHSQCRTAGSCWDQVGWSWPETILVPAGAPDPGSNGLAHQPLVFLEPPQTSRLVLVLDRSGSMSSESPSRLERLKTAALDVVSLAEDGVELGVVSYSSTASDEVAVAALGADRSAFNTAINNLSAGGATNIGDGLQHAHDMIMAAGGVTAETGIILMTDGRNNRPSGSAAADLAAKLALLQAANIPVYVTCTGDDTGSASQCAEIAAGAGAGGTYVDSEDASRLPPRFVKLYESLVGREPTTSDTGAFGSTSRRHAVDVEAGASIATFVAQWKSKDIAATMMVEDPDGVVFTGRSMPLGAYYRAHAPKPGIWHIWLVPGGTDQPGSSGRDSAALVTRERRVVADERFGWLRFLIASLKHPERVDPAYQIQTFVENQLISVPAAARFKVIQPGEAFEVCAYPLQGGHITGVTIFGEVQTPSGRRGSITLLDDGRASGQSGDDEAGDGIYCGRFSDTRERGAYQFRLKTVALQPKHAEDYNPSDPPPTEPLVPFGRWTEFSATVDDTVPDGRRFGFARCGAEITPFAGLFDMDGQLPIGDGPVAGLRVAACRTPRWDLEGELGLTFAEDTRGNDGTILQASLNGLFHLNSPGATVRPFVTAGVGGLFFRGFTFNDEALALNLGVGLKARLTPRYALRFDLRDYIADNAYGAGTTDNYQATLGLAISVP